MEHRHLNMGMIPPGHFLGNGDAHSIIATEYIAIPHDEEFRVHRRTS
ncbi:MAG: hypothetical protein U0840_05065 [Gemmataceae bacterium]